MYSCTTRFDWNIIRVMKRKEKIIIHDRNLLVFLTCDYFILFPADVWHISHVHLWGITRELQKALWWVKFIFIGPANGAVAKPGDLFFFYHITTTTRKVDTSQATCLSKNWHLHSTLPILLTTQSAGDYKPDLCMHLSIGALFCTL